MSLDPGAPRLVDGKWVLDDVALADTMALAIEEELDFIMGRVKGMPSLPAASREDRRILFVAIARGVLKYLENHQDDALDNITLEPSGAPQKYNVTAMDFDIPEFES